jgi:hypothetical protein
MPPGGGIHPNHFRCRWVGIMRHRQVVRRLAVLLRRRRVAHSMTTRRLPPKPSRRRRRQGSFRQPPDQASSHWTSQGLSELARTRKTSSRSWRKMRRTVCRLLPVRRTIRLIGTAYSATVRTATFVSSRRRDFRTASAPHRSAAPGRRCPRRAPGGSRHRSPHHVEEGAAGVLHQIQRSATCAASGVGRATA